MGRQFEPLDGASLVDGYPALAVIQIVLGPRLREDAVLGGKLVGECTGGGQIVPANGRKYRVPYDEGVTAGDEGVCQINGGLDAAGPGERDGPLAVQPTVIELGEDL